MITFSDESQVGEKEELKKELEAGFDKELLAESTAWRVRYDNLEVRHAERDKQQRERLKRQEDEIARLMEKNAALEKRLDPESAATTKSKAGMNTEGSQPRRVCVEQDPAYALANLCTEA